MDQDRNSLWEAEEGVPQLQDPFIQRFLAGRDSLIQKEATQRHDSNLRNALAPTAIRACQIVSEVCTQERTSIQEAYQSDEIPFQSLTSDGAEGSDLWKIVRRLPKGSLLHGNLPAMVDTDFLIDQAFSTPGLHISAPGPLIPTQWDYQNAPFSFQIYSRPPDTSGAGQTLWSAEYKPSTPIDLRSAAATFPDGAETGFRRWLKSRLALTLDHHRHGSRTISDSLSLCLSIVDSLFHYEPILRSCLRRIFSQLAADKIRYVEFRVGFTFQYRLQGSDTSEPDYLGWFRIFQEELGRFRGSEEGNEFYGARIIWATMRGLSNQEIGINMKQCLLAKRTFPDLICGFDFLGQETHERPLGDLLPILFWFRGRCAEEGIEIPFIFHAGQSLGDGDRADGNLFDAALLGSRRISQALSLYKHPLLIDVLKSKNILVEYCPTSSSRLGLTSSFQSHPLPALLSRGVSVALTNDSPGIFGLGPNGLSTEFFQALLAFHNMGLTGLTMLVENSIRWSCYEDQPTKEWSSEIEEGILGEGLKAVRLQEFYTDFESFCEWVVQEFKGKYGSD
ncbi:hypothetical protein BJX61DRAFT_6218 [Aspergillus egyptiacus]|nr:hypothetical protein BJX61DRAFT_6218 [Aspergillus egyptiacus]